MTQKVADNGIKALRQVLAVWPKDSLRPECELGATLAKSLDRRVAAGLTDTSARVQAETLRFLMADRLKELRPVPFNVLRPKSKPEYFDELLKELDAVPERSWLGALWIRIKGKVRI